MSPKARGPRLGFDGLVDFAQATSPADADRFRDPLGDAVNRVPRPAPPEWITSDNTTAVRVRPGVRITIEEGRGDPADLPGGVEGQPADVLAYYLPYHFYRRTAWGIYLRAAGVLALARGLAGVSVTRDDDPVIPVATSVLFEHEYYHCVVETAATRAEFAAAQGAYRAYVYSHAASEHEEALANAHAFAVARRRHPRVSDDLRKWMLGQPAGYRDFAKWSGAAPFALGRAEAAGHILRGISGPVSRPPAGGEYLVATAGVPRSRIPTYFVTERGLAAQVVRPFPKTEGMRILVHSRDHPPPHVHVEMPPGKDRGRLRWPSLEPLDGTAAFSSAERARLERYLARIGSKVSRRVTELYGPVEPPSGFELEIV